MEGVEQHGQGPVQLPLPVQPVVAARTVGVGPDGDAELPQPLEEGEVLRVEVSLDLPGLSTDRRRVERPWLAVAEGDEQADAVQPGRQVVGVVLGPDIALSSWVTPQRAWDLAEVTQQALDQLGARDWVSLVAGV